MDNYELLKAIQIEQEHAKEERAEIIIQIKEILDILQGKDGSFGLTQKLRIMWSSLVVWPLCTLSAGMGIFATLIIQRILK